MLGLSRGRDFLEIVFDLCEQYRLPFLLPLKAVEQPFFSGKQKELFGARIHSAQRRGIHLIDDLVSLPYCVDASEGYGDIKSRLAGMIKNLQPGITQLTAHPSFVTEELRALTCCYREREAEYRLLKDPDIMQLLETEGIGLLSWQDIRDWQRKEG